MSRYLYCRLLPHRPLNIGLLPFLYGSCQRDSPFSLLTAEAVVKETGKWRDPRCCHEYQEGMKAQHSCILITRDLSFPEQKVGMLCLNRSQAKQQ